MSFDHQSPHGYAYHGITIPPDTAKELEAWITRGEAPGSFLQAVLCNDLRESFGRASATTRLALHAIVVYLYNEAPGPCWGSPEKVKAWAERRAQARADAATAAAMGEHADRVAEAVFGRRTGAAATVMDIAAGRIFPPEGS